MKVRKVKKMYECPNCGTINEGEPQKVTAWRCVEVNEEFELTTVEPEEVEAYVMACCETAIAMDDVDNIDEGYMCGECKSLYFDRDEAKECCKE